MEIQKLLNEIVMHKTFGKGVINSVDDQYLQVKFFEGSKTSKFVYPSCFDGFLMLENKEKQADIQKNLEQWKVESGANQKEKLKRQYEKTMLGIKTRRIAAEEKKLKATQRMMEHRITYGNVKTEKRE